MPNKYTIKFADKEVEASDYQNDIFDNVEHGVGNMIIEAAAGAAKTTTIVNCMRLIPDSKTVLFIAFNKDIVETIREKIGYKPNIRISTFHSLGLAIFKENNGQLKDGQINEYKYKNYIKANIDNLTEFGETRSMGSERGTYVNNIINLTEYSRYYMAFTELQMKRIAEKYGIVLIRDEISVCRKVLKWGKSNLDTIDYTDMIWLPNILNYVTKKYRYNWVLIDEAQDVTIAEEKLIEKCFKRGCRVVIAGDRTQMINVWAGSDEEAINNFAKMPHTKHFKLPITYRCPKKIVELAKRFSSDIIAADNAVDGQVNYNVSINAPKAGDMVLCRITSPLIGLHLHYMRINKKSYVRGYENIRERYLSLIEATKSVNIDKSFNTSDGLIPSLYRMLIEQIDIVKSEYSLDDYDAILFPSVLAIYDAIQGIKVMCEGLVRVSDLKGRIETIFNGDEKDAIQLSTVHKAKGLEADNVFILNPSMMPIKYAKKEWEVNTEKNLIYVAITRAKKSLNYMAEDKKNSGKTSNVLDKAVIAADIAFARKQLGEAVKSGIKEYRGGDMPVKQGLREIERLGTRIQPKKKKPMSKFSGLLKE